MDPSSLPPNLDHDERAHIKHLVRHHVHDLRNYINCVNIEATLLGESSDDTEIKNTIQSICNQLQEMDQLVTTFSKNFKDYPDPKNGSL